MGEPIQLYKEDEQVTVYAKSEARRLLDDGWQDSAPVVEVQPVEELSDEPVAQPKRATRRRKA
jgi:hypothetical protein